MQKVSNIISFALMLAITLVVIFHCQIWTCCDTTSDVTTKTILVYDTVQVKVVSEVPPPVKIVYRYKPVLIPSTTTPTTTPEITFIESLFNQPTITLKKADTNAIVGLFMEAVFFYTDTVESIEKQVQAIINDSVRANQIIFRSVFLQNNRPTQEVDLKGYSDRFQLFIGGQFGALSDYDNTFFRPMAGIEVFAKFKTNTVFGVGILAGQDRQLYTVKVAQLIRFKKLGDRLREKRMKRDILRLSAF